ncbi:MAG: hypothetical protein A2776_01780 [Candidatus Levybacteria bacterium RIFCSPHIGHO2_01_FULL_40_10]|nr:MAG: hypothetical protein A2776_01780 [Candidatus Levybacteria bacterium RIFCSPHIGHO2_01_FULL_40_10]
MDQVTLTAAWMTFNVALSIIPIIAVRLFIKSKSKPVKLASGLIWFFFLPNTVYLITDIINLSTDIHIIRGIYLLANAAIYLMLIPVGIATYILAVYPFEDNLPKKSRFVTLFFLNVCVGFGLVLGRIQRANSWEVLTDVNLVIAKSVEILRSYELIALVLVFAVFCQLIYFNFKKRVVKKFT